ncbi:putative dsRNA-binding protein [Streptomyces sp. DH41]|uniref:putative dsRNA-binding protein n=1 Tax=Streptomyces sp. DH41 TaxID=3040125 RepID=UPI0024433027|nr:putative dsRNA-binding protein [Streptomyces sp. DH41]MDG9722384.1 putative dsRNA-binding protein [Streptomyces sp. DH41]
MNRWVGIVSLRETAAPTPVHRIALAIEAARQRTSYSLDGRQVPYEKMRATLRRIGQRYAARSEWGRWSYCVDLAGDFFDGGGPLGRLSGWLTADLRAELDGKPTVSVGDRARQRKRDGVRSQSRGGSTSRRKNPVVAAPVRKAAHPPRATRSTAAGTPRPYVRVERQLTVRDIPPPALVQPPAALVGTFGKTVQAAIQDSVGEWEAGEQTTAWLGLAATHLSRLYESGFSETAVTPHVLVMLDQLGRSTIDVILLDAWIAQRQPEKVGTQSSEHNRRSMEARRVLGQWAAEHGLVRMGAGEAQRPAASVAEGVARQILGVLSLTGAHGTAVRLVQAVCAGIDHDTDEIGGADPLTEAQEIFAKEGLSYEYAEDGPDHDRTYTAVARTGDGRSARGEGRNKKAARAAAARALLRGLPPTRRAAARPAETAGITVPPQPYRNAPPRAHRDALGDLTAMFELDDRRTAGTLTQALTHSSYVHENRAEAAAHHQRDNQLLAHHGSLIISHLATHARVGRVLAHGLVPDEDEARVHTPANEDAARLGTTLALADGVLTGRGEDGRRPRTVADAAQSVVAAAWRLHGTRLLRRRPAVLDDWLSELQHQHDPVTVMNYLAAMFGMTHHYEYERTGLDHLQTFAATLVLSDARGRVHRWTVPPERPSSKKDADKATAQDVLDILTTPADDLVDTLTTAERDLLRYLLRAQLDGLGTTTLRQRSRMVSGGLLGTDLLVTGDLDAFRAWARRVQDLLGSEDTAVPEALGALYRQILAETRFGPRSLLRRMAADQGNDTAGTVRRHAAEAVGRAAASGPWGVTVREVVQDWWRDQASRTGVTVRDDMRQEPFLPLPAQLAALDETLTWCGEVAEATGSPVEVELTVQDGTLHTWIGLDGLDTRAACDDFARLLSRTLPRTDCLVDDDHVMLRLHGRPDTESLTPLATAGIDAYLSAAGAPSSPANVPEDEPAAIQEEAH